MVISVNAVLTHWQALGAAVCQSPEKEIECYHITLANRSGIRLSMPLTTVDGAVSRWRNDMQGLTDRRPCWHRRQKRHVDDCSTAILSTATSVALIYRQAVEDSIPAFAAGAGRHRRALFSAPFAGTRAWNYQQMNENCGVFWMDPL